MPSACSICSGWAASSVVHRAEVLGELLGVDVADAGDARARRGPSRRASSWSPRSPHQVPRRDLAEPLELADPLGGQVVDVGRVGDQALLEEPVGVLLAQALDLQGAPEVLDVLELLARAAGAVGADREDRVLGLDRRRAAERALLRRLRLPQALALAPLDDRRDDLGDHVAGAQDDHLVARRGRPCARGPPRCGASRCVTVTPLTWTGSSIANGTRCPVAADVPDDLVQLRRRRGRRELPGDRPARLAPGDAELALQAAVVDLDDHAVDLEVELVAAVLPPAAALRDLVDRPCAASTSSLTWKPRSRSHSSISCGSSGSQPPRAPIP